MVFEFNRFELGYWGLPDVSEVDSVVVGQRRNCVRRFYLPSDFSELVTPSAVESGSTWPQPAFREMARTKAAAAKVARALFSDGKFMGALCGKWNFQIGSFRLAVTDSVQCIQMRDLAC